MSEDEARNEIIRILKKFNWYAVRWDGHTDRYFCCLKLAEKSDKTNEIYGAIFESYYDLVEDDEEIIKIAIGYDCNSWNTVLNKLKQLPIDFT